MFAAIEIPQFPLQAALRHEPELWSKSVALVDPALSTPRVCEATGAARAAGITLGLTPTQALARCRDVVIRHRSPAHERSATDALLQGAYGFSPHLENTAPGLATLDLRGLSELKNAAPEALARWATRLRDCLAVFQLRARIGIAPTPNLARHAARWGASVNLPTAERQSAPSERGPLGRSGNVPPITSENSQRLRETGAAAGGDARAPGAAATIHIVTDPVAFIASLPVAALEPSTDVTDILKKWGIPTVGELLALGQNAVMDRLGLEALALFAAASPTASRPLSIIRPVEEFAETFEFEDAVETLEPLLFLLRRFVDQLTPRLEIGGKVAGQLILRLGLESGDPLERRLRVPQPTRQPDVLFRMLHTHLETVRSDSAIVTVTLRIEPAEPEHKQFSLFEAALRDPQQFQDTVARLTALLGSDRVGTPVRENSHRPDAFRMVPPDFENAPRAATSRVGTIARPVALRRLRPAEKVDVTTAPGAAAPTPVALQCTVARGKLKIVLGPWRASGHWWEPGAWQRDEWDITTQSGQTLRLAHQPDGWTVEGMLD